MESVLYFLIYIFPYCMLHFLTKLAPMFLFRQLSKMFGNMVFSYVNKPFTFYSQILLFEMLIFKLWQMLW